MAALLPRKYSGRIASPYSWPGNSIVPGALSSQMRWKQRLISSASPSNGAPLC